MSCSVNEENMHEECWSVDEPCQYNDIAYHHHVDGGSPRESLIQSVTNILTQFNAKLHLAACLNNTYPRSTLANTTTGQLLAITMRK